MASVGLRKRKREEYEMQLFGFHSRSAYTNLENMIKEVLVTLTGKMCDSIEKTYKLDPEKFKNERRKFLKAYGRGLAPYLNKIKSVTEKFITVPENILLEEDKIQRTQYTEEEMENMRSGLQHLQQRMKKAVVLNATLKEELQLIEQLEPCENLAKRLCDAIEDYQIYPKANKKVITLANNSVALLEHLESSNNDHGRNKVLCAQKIDNLELQRYNLDDL